ncbi:MAG: aspartate/glutamate racemase family protein [Formosimonas sp.]
MPRIGLIHALALSVAPIHQAFAQHWPQARLMNLLDDSLSADLAVSPNGLDAAMTERFQTLAQYALDQGCDALLFTCSAFGSCIEAVQARHPNVPIYKPNQAMIAQAAAHAPATIGLVASFAPTLQSMPQEFPAHLILKSELADKALAALNAGDGAAHDANVVQAALRLVEQGCGVIALTQFSMARAADAVRQATGLPVLSTPEAAVLALKQRLGF